MANPGGEVTTPRESSDDVSIYSPPTTFLISGWRQLPCKLKGKRVVTKEDMNPGSPQQVRFHSRKVNVPSFTFHVRNTQLEPSISGKALVHDSSVLGFSLDAPFRDYVAGVCICDHRWLLRCWTVLLDLVPLEMSFFTTDLVSFVDEAIVLASEMLESRTGPGSCVSSSLLSLTPLRRIVICTSPCSLKVPAILDGFRISEQDLLQLQSPSSGHGECYLSSSKRTVL